MAVDIQYCWTTRIGSTSQSSPYVLKITLVMEREYVLSRGYGHRQMLIMYGKAISGETPAALGLGQVIFIDQQEG